VPLGEIRWQCGRRGDNDDDNVLLLVIESLLLLRRLRLRFVDVSSSESPQS
jgi:hypothetical protein